MLQEGYMMKTAGFAPTQHQLRARIAEVVGEAEAETFYQNWRDNHFREADVQKMKEAGFNSVRLPMHFNLFTPPIEDEPIAGEQTWLEEGFRRTDELIQWCKARDMYVVLDLHAAPGGQGDDVAISDRDLSKPSLWESEANKDKTVALWRRLAERYADEPTVAGYDLINEINYILPGNVAIRELYGRITDTIRAVDTRHIIFIEGNGFANDFTGLTPPWDDNMVYSPHKYWNFNDQGSVQWMFDLGATYNVPIYLGETGENSNVWFHDAAKLLEDNNIGFAWWPWKKIDDIAGPVSVELNPGYQDLLDYWAGTGPMPSATDAVNALAVLTENALLENAKFQQDVTHALLVQTQEATTVPYLETHAVPGVIHAVNYDMGGLGNAYEDTQNANYRISTGGDFTAWNNGWSYRNDGVDIEPCTDTELNNGFNVGWTDDGEWLQYAINVTEPGLYDVTVRTASGAGGGQLSLRSGEEPLVEALATGATGGWQNWQNTTFRNVTLTDVDTKLRLYIDQGGYNIGGMQLTRVAASSALDTDFLTAEATENTSVRVTFNKSLKREGLRASDFSLSVNGEAASVTAAEFTEGTTRTVTLATDTRLRSADVICVTYTGADLAATDDLIVQPFNCRPVDNRIALAYPIPGTLQAEDFFRMSGVEVENSGDVGGTQNIGFLDPQDFLDYNVDVSAAGTYSVDYRTAAADGFTGRFLLQLLDDNDEATTLHDISFPSTGGWQTYETVSAPAVTLPAGPQRLRILVVDGAVNVNYLVFSLLTDVQEDRLPLALAVSPNPTSDVITITGELPAALGLNLTVTDNLGRQVLRRALPVATQINTQISLADLPAGAYYLRLSGRGGEWYGTSVVRE
ncbi:hypothetical protein A3850_004570 [Lewinella sp. 4G2]|nr:hypothetical protein A3850_004570 [Lewinella sp. 4G2]